MEGSGAMKTNFGSLHNNGLYVRGSHKSVNSQLTVYANKLKHCPVTEDRSGIVQLQLLIT